MFKSFSYKFITDFKISINLLLPLQKFMNLKMSALISKNFEKFTKVKRTKKYPFFANMSNI